MILDSLENASGYESLHPGFRQAFAYLRETDFAKLTPGRHEIAGANLYLMLNQGPGRGREGAKLEAHRQYIDIQYTIVGPDEIGWQPVNECRQIEAAYDEGKDFQLFADRPQAWCTVPAGSFAVFFPSDGHAPMGAPQSTALRKAVLKVAVRWQ